MKLLLIFFVTCLASTMGQWMDPWAYNGYDPRTELSPDPRVPNYFYPANPNPRFSFAIGAGLRRNDEEKVEFPEEPQPQYPPQTTVMSIIDYGLKEWKNAFKGCNIFTIIKNAIEAIERFILKILSVIFYPIWKHFPTL